MALPKVGPTLTQGRFSQRVSGPIGGNERSGPWQGFPIHLAAKRRYWEYFNDFNSRADFDQATFEPNRTDGTTPIARVSDWLIAEIGAGSLEVAPTQTVANLLSDVSYGVLRVSAGGTDSTGGRAYRPLAGGNVSELLSLDRSGTLAAGEFRFRLTETGTAGQSAINIGWCGDDQATLTTAGVQAGTAASSIYFIKELASTTLVAGMTGTAVTTTTLNVGTLVSGTWYTVSWRYRCTATAVGAANMDVYFDGLFIGTTSNSSATPVPAVQQYAPQFAVVNGVGADATLDIDYITAVTERA